jgi:hypothetical protein
MIAGYPASRNRVRSRVQGLPSRATFFVMRELLPLTSLRATDKSDDVYFALSVPVEHRRADGGTFHVPDLRGMSGGGIWRFGVDNRTRLVTTPTLIGIGIEFHKRERAIVATRIQAAIPLVRDAASHCRLKRHSPSE